MPFRDDQQYIAHEVRRSRIERAAGSLGAGVYAGGSAVAVFVGDGYAGVTNNHVKFQFFVESHNQTQRGLVLQGNSYTAASTFRNLTFKIQSDDTMQVQWRNSGGTNNNINTAVVPVGVWLSVEFYIDGNNYELKVDWDANQSGVSDYSPVYAGGDWRILDDGTALSTGVKITKVRWFAGGNKALACNCDEGAGNTSINYGIIGNGSIVGGNIHGVYNG
jgi:hypothetical protein